MSIKIKDPDVIVHGLQNLLVNELSGLVLKPLFQKIYNCEVSFVNVGGKQVNDLIIHKSDELGDPCTICVQVCRISSQMGSGFNQSEQRLVNQLSNIKREGVVCDVTKAKLQLTKVILVTPFVMDSSTNSEQFKALSIAVRAHHIRLIDGKELANLISHKFPELLHRFVDKCYLINQSVRQSLDNETLLNAFNLEQLDTGQAGYCQISVAPGRNFSASNHSTNNTATAADYAKVPDIYNSPLQPAVMEDDCDIEQLFDSGENIAVLGDAGSGKTTNLKHYAAKLLDQNTDKLVIFTTLNKIAECAENLGSESILDGLVGYLGQINSQVTVSALAEHFTHQKAVVILDSIDEAIVEHEWVIRALIIFSENFPKCQIITSSRYSVEGLSDIPFFHLSILPLDEQQKRAFIDKWFAQTPDKGLQLLEHLVKHPQLNRFISNPLSATILCVLFQNDVPLPKSEAALYKKRIEMLAGVYDHYRGIKRTSLEPTFLIDVARVIAFGMHIRKRSSFDKSFALSVCLNFFTEPQQAKLVEKAIDELISVTEIIVPSPNGGYDFGHLRIQEFLASQELINRRNINYKELLKDNWWGEAFVLMSQHAREIESVVNEVCASGNVGRVRPLLMKMIGARSKREKEIFTKRVNQSQSSENTRYY